MGDQFMTEINFKTTMLRSRANIIKAEHCPLSHKCLEQCDYWRDTGYFDYIKNDVTNPSWNPFMNLFERLLMRANCRALCAVGESNGSVYHKFTLTEKSKKNPKSDQEYVYSNSTCAPGDIGNKEPVNFPQIRAYDQSQNPCQIFKSMDEDLTNFFNAEKKCRLNCLPSQVGPFLS